MANYRSDSEKLSFLSAKIQRLQSSLERLESLGLSTISSNGNSKTFIDMEKISMALARAEAEFKIVSDRIDGIKSSSFIKKIEVDFTE